MRCGHPDLILFGEASYCWVEVKGPGDQRQHHQARWLTEFDRLGAEYVVSHAQLGPPLAPSEYLGTRPVTRTVVLTLHCDIRPDV